MTVVRTIDAWSPIVAGVLAYLSDPARLGMAAPDVVPGEWQTTWNEGPSKVTIGLGKKLTYAGAAADPPGYSATPNDIWDNGDGTACPIVGVRKQSFIVWVHYGPDATDFSAHDPVAYALDMRTQTLALSDTVHAALRYIAQHDLLGEDGQPYGEQQGEFVFGSTVSWGFMLPVPVLGDAYPYATPMGETATVLFVGTTPGDTVTT